MEQEIIKVISAFNETTGTDISKIIEKVKAQSPVNHPYEAIYEAIKSGINAGKILMKNGKLKIPKEKIDRQLRKKDIETISGSQILQNKKRHGSGAVAVGSIKHDDAKKSGFKLKGSKTFTKLVPKRSKVQKILKKIKKRTKKNNKLRGLVNVLAHYEEADCGPNCGNPECLCYVPSIIRPGSY